MGYRKLIGFGDSSFVVSLPKDWVNKHGLKKGDGLIVDVDNGQFLSVSLEKYMAIFGNFFVS